ncbi:MAG: putative rane protein [Frankiales bacterium]|jgi:uncharacterized membrane protein|nr:putative rane protein [Frankiales bacterium]
MNASRPSAWLTLSRMHGASTGMRIAVSTLVGIAVAILVIALGIASYAPAVGWDAAAFVLEMWTWLVIARMNPDQTADHATREDPTRSAGDSLLLLAAVASLSAVGFFLIQANSASGSTRDWLAGVGLITVALSWLLVHTVYTLRYASLYYGGRDGGVDFNQSTPPRYSDFAYLAFTIGMTFQVSDTDLQTTPIRSTALRQALLSYLFGAVILAVTINLVAGLAGRS